MKKTNGFIATSLLYTFFLAFVTLFIGMITIYLQNRVYLNHLEDSSKNSVYIREMRDKIGSTQVKVGDPSKTGKTLTKYENDIFTYDGKTCNFAKCELIYYDGTYYILEGCESTC